MALLLYRSLITCIDTAFPYPTKMSRLLTSLALIVTAATAHAQSASPQQPGTKVLERMRAAYAGKWYHTLTFVQQTSIYRDTNVVKQQWLESVRHTPEQGGQLRIDAGELSSGNGTLYTADSTWIVRAGRLAGTRPKGNEFLPLIHSVYLQPVERTAREVSLMHVDLSQVRAGEWRGRKVTVVGATAASDTTSPQFWIDEATNVLVRMVLHDAAANSPVLDVHLDGYVPAGKGMLGTDVKIYLNGKLYQEERYTDWKTDVNLDDALFDPLQWTTAAHWGKK